MKESKKTWRCSCGVENEISSGSCYWCNSLGGTQDWICPECGMMNGKCNPGSDKKCSCGTRRYKRNLSWLRYVLFVTGLALILPFLFWASIVTIICGISAAFLILISLLMEWSK